MNFKDIKYLKEGNNRQVSLYSCISINNILNILDSFNPVLVSTICVNLDLAKSDVDIVCEAKDFSAFLSVAKSNFQNFKNFKTTSSKERCIASFEISPFIFEIYCSKTPVNMQNGFIHFSVMHKILQIGGEKLRKQILKYKEAGLKTEPAIAKVLNLSGNPYEAVSDLDNFSDFELKLVIELALVNPSTGSGFIYVLENINKKTHI